MAVFVAVIMLYVCLALAVKALDRYDVRSRKERILAKRGALTWLPVCFKNDLVHGSWCVRSYVHS